VRFGRSALAQGPTPALKLSPDASTCAPSRRTLLLTAPWGGGGVGYSFKMPGRSQRVALTSGRQGTKAGLSPSTVTPAFVSSFKPACSVVCACLWGCGGCALLPLVLALEVCRRSACFILVLCMRLVVTGGGVVIHAERWQGVLA
jgi:hypothetical protein